MGGEVEGADHRGDPGLHITACCLAGLATREQGGVAPVRGQTPGQGLNQGGLP